VGEGRLGEETDRGRVVHPVGALESNHSLSSSGPAVISGSHGPGEDLARFRRGSWWTGLVGMPGGGALSRCPRWLITTFDRGVSCRRLLPRCRGGDAAGAASRQVVQRALSDWMKGPFIQSHCMKGPFMQWGRLREVGK
jgi:hypothetical protein